METYLLKELGRREFPLNVREKNRNHNFNGVTGSQGRNEQIEGVIEEFFPNRRSETGIVVRTTEIISDTIY